MLTQENDVEIHALAARGWNQSAISRHTGRDRKTVRRYLSAGEEPAAREAAASCLEPWRAYIAERFIDDPHLPAVSLLDEITITSTQPPRRPATVDLDQHPAAQPPQAADSDI